MEELQLADSLVQRGIDAHEHDTRTVAALLVATITPLNPEAAIIRTTPGWRSLNCWGPTASIWRWRSGRLAGSSS